MNVDMIWGKILFEVLLFSELRCNTANMAAKCRCILLQKGFELSMTDGLGDHFQFFGCFTPVHNFKLFPNVIREILLFYIDNNWRDFLITVFEKCFWVCWNACVFSKYLQLQSVILGLCAQTGFYLFAKFASTKFFGLIRSKDLNELNMLVCSDTNFWWRLLKSSFSTRFWIRDFPCLTFLVSHFPGSAVETLPRLYKLITAL